MFLGISEVRLWTEVNPLTILFENTNEEKVGFDHSDIVYSQCHAQ